MKSERDIEQLLDAWFEEEARPMPPLLLESVLETIPRVSRRRTRGPFALPPIGQRLAGVAVAAVLLVGAILVGPQVARIVLPDSQGVVGGIPGCVAPPQGLTHWWPGDGSGRDIVGGSDARLADDATFGPGLVGQAFSFDGSGDFAFVPDLDTVDVGRGDFAIALWVKFVETTGEQVLAEKWIQRFGTPSTGWTLTKLATGAITVVTEEPGGSTDAQSPPDVVPTGHWLFVVAQRKGAALSLYVDGNLVAANSIEGPAIDLASGSSLKFGHRGAATDTPGSEDERGFFLNGQMDEVQLLVGRVLSEDEIRRIYDAGPAGQCKP